MSQPEWPGVPPGRGLNCDPQEIRLHPHTQNLCGCPSLEKGSAEVVKDLEMGLFWGPVGSESNDR